MVLHSEIVFHLRKQITLGGESFQWLFFFHLFSYGSTPRRHSFESICSGNSLLSFSLRKYTQLIILLRWLWQLSPVYARMFYTVQFLLQGSTPRRHSLESICSGNSLLSFFYFTEVHPIDHSYEMTLATLSDYDRKYTTWTLIWADLSWQLFPYGLYSEVVTFLEIIWVDNFLFVSLLYWNCLYHDYCLFMMMSPSYFWIFANLFERLFGADVPRQIHFLFSESIPIWSLRPMTWVTLFQFYNQYIPITHA
jgi:hypothetical protein